MTSRSGAPRPWLCLASVCLLSPNAVPLIHRICKYLASIPRPSGAPNPTTEVPEHLREKDQPPPLTPRAGSKRGRADAGTPRRLTRAAAALAQEREQRPPSPERPSKRQRTQPPQQQQQQPVATPGLLTQTSQAVLRLLGLPTQPAASSRPPSFFVPNALYCSPLPYAFPPQPVEESVPVDLVDAGVSQTQVTFPVEVDRDPEVREESFRCSMLVRVLETRLVNKLRFEFGETYSVSGSIFFGAVRSVASLDIPHVNIDARLPLIYPYKLPQVAPGATGKLRGDMAFSYSCLPEMKDQMREMTLAEVARFQEEGPTPQEIETAIEIMERRRQTEVRRQSSRRFLRLRCPEPSGLEHPPWGVRGRLGSADWSAPLHDTQGFDSWRVRWLCLCAFSGCSAPYLPLQLTENSYWEDLIGSALKSRKYLETCDLDQAYRLWEDARETVFQQ